MARIVFFEKTGCINNTKQKNILTLAGHEVEPLNLLHYSWTNEELLSFFEGVEVKDWFNRNAPAIASGQLIPESFDPESALKTLIKEPILIKRPLMIVDGHRIVGFDTEKLDALIGIKGTQNAEARNLLHQNLTVCAQKDRGYKCD
ncbi:ArsC/Spx/MgsR family protein [Mangrovibacterium sp.]|uniref:ArsC/Spx/MgsR family protein n=1 Tax=Mangrovibacterium sp. TaxID=1961364 RepID=UPI00356B0625